ncbi:response regulator transcription factor [Variovorax sp. CCNWLW235]|uniref:response regulator transcription factor n=1 Tax=Variovorax sp. CCNWLW235 TaxID=3127463 RepID=UPI0030771776
MTTETEHALSVALLDTQAERRTTLEDKLVLLGHQPIVFADVSELLITLCIGQRFDLLLLTLHDQKLHRSLSEVCKRLRIPTLLMVEDAQWGALAPRSEDSSWDDAIDFDVLETRIQELDWRIRSLFKGGHAPAQLPWLESEMTWGDYKFTPDSTTVRYRGRDIHLTQLELAFAVELFRNIGRVLTRDWLLKKLWTNKPRLDGTRTVDVCATKVRKKLDLRYENGFVLRGIYRQGYQLVSVSPSTGR